MSGSVSGESLRSEGRARACEGIVRSRFGKRPSIAGTRALQRLRASDRRFGTIRGLWSRSSGLRAGVLVASVALLVIALVWFMVSSSKLPEARPVPGDGEQAAGDSQEPQQKPSGNREPGAVQVQRRGGVPEGAEDEQPGPTDEPKPVDETPGGQPDEGAVLASVGDVTGEVKVRRKGEEEWKDTAVLLNILPGDTVRTESGGRARLDMDEGDYVCLNNNAEVTVEKDTDEFLFKLGRGEICVEKAEAEGAMAVETGFGRVRSRGGRFHMQKLSEDKYLVHVLDGEVECHDRGADHVEKYGSRTQAWFEKGKPCDRGTQFDSDEAFAWADNMSPKRMPHGPGRRPGPGRRGPSRSASMGRFLWKILEEFDKLDANGDGRVSAEEAKFPDKEAWGKLIEELDTDRDGELSSQECEAMREKMKERKGPGRRGRGGPPPEGEGPDEGRK